MNNSSLFVSSFLAVALPLTAASNARSQTVPIENSVAVPNAKILAEFNATGVQYYVCKQDTNDPTKTEWAFAGPLAQLTSIKTGEVVGIHFGASDGPHWELFDQSKIVGKLTGTEKSLTPNSIDSYRLSVIKNNGQGVAATATDVVRDNTVGGVKPSRPCIKDNLNNDKTGVYYSARYTVYER